jgi:hypothetical protein
MEYEFEAIKVQALNVGLSLKSPPSCQPDDSSSSAWFQLPHWEEDVFLALRLGTTKSTSIWQVIKRCSIMTAHLDEADNFSSCPSAQPLCFVIPVGQDPFYKALAFCDLIITVEYLEPMKWKLSNFSVLLPVQELLDSERQPWARPALIVSPVGGLNNTPGEIVMEAYLKVSPTLAAPPAQDIADEDISFNAEKGIFTISVRTTIGQAILPVLADRVMQIKRLIELLNVFHQYTKPAKFDICSLRAITLAYSSPTTAADEGGTRYGVHINFDVVANEIACYLQSEENVPLSLQVHLDRMQPGTIKKRQCIYLLHSLAAQPALDAIEKGIAAISVMDLSHYRRAKESSLSSGSTHSRRISIKLKMGPFKSSISTLRA